MVTLAGSELNSLVDSHRSHLTEVQDEDVDTDLVQELEIPENLHENIAVEGVKMQTSDQFDASPLPTSSRGASISTNSPGQISDDASAQSVSVSQTPEPQSASTREPTSAREEAGLNALNQPRPSSSRSSTPHEEGPLAQQQRRARHRSTLEGRANRLSGFFNSLMSRRDTVVSSNSRGGTRDDPPPSASTPIAESQSRSSSPPPARPTTPPPSLPAPTLQELGISFSVLTSDLSPSHFSTPPTSGAFLAPHYLLLCHAQGLDVLPLVSPPAPQPYALIRRVNFKSVVVMEHRGVLVAIAGRRYGVRVYALEEVKKMIEWRMEVEVRREQERYRRENVKKLSLAGIDALEERRSNETKKTSLSTPPPGSTPRTGVLRKTSYTSSIPPLPTTSPPLIPRPPTYKPPRKQRIPQSKPTGASPNPGELPPSYATATSAAASTRTPSVSRNRSGSISEVLRAVPHAENDRVDHADSDIKTDWAGASDDEAIDIVAAGPSGSQALDERTSSQAQPAPAPMQLTAATSPPSATHTRSGSMTSRRNRPSNLDLSVPRSTANVVPEPSPSPTLLTLRQALSASPTSMWGETPHEPETPLNNAEIVDDEDDEGDGGLSLAQILMESRLPDLPPIGTRQPQQPILLASASASTAPSSPRTSEGHEAPRRPDTAQSSTRRRRRWSVLLGGAPEAPESLRRATTPTTPTTAPPTSEGPRSRFTRSQSFRSAHSFNAATRPATAGDTPTSRSTTNLPDSASRSSTALSNITPTQSSRTSRFFPRLFTNALQGRRSDERSPVRISHLSDTETTRRTPATPSIPHAPPPKLEYVKLPGTKNALMIKAVETPKKSFLAILCGENGEKVELFAGTYRTALGLSRTFILPDSPRSLELQLQGDDLVEVFLVFMQNVFGLEPATVRVREVRIGRAERRAARRRAREARAGEANATDTENGPGEEETNINVSIAVPASTANGDNTRPGSPTLVPSEHPDAHPDNQDTQNEAHDGTPDASSVAIAHAEELVTIATANMGPYTTFQQLNFAPKFPLASIADDYIIPPTYASFLDYRTEHEPEGSGNVDLTRVQFSPPGLPVPVPTAPPRWYYRDPKGVIHGPWKASLMQAWYKDGMLPPDLPVRREEDENFMLLKDLRLQSVDPTSPFQSPPPPPPSTTELPSIQEAGKPLLHPISLLAQPKHFGPPALFFSSRGGHSTSIVDARGRSVIKGRFIWSSEDSSEDTRALSSGRMGDVKRLEALDVQDRSVLIAMRQGGLEAVDLSDALLNPADESRTSIPNFLAPPSSINRRAPYVWKIGTPVSTSGASATILSSKSKGSIMGRKSIGGPTKSPSSRAEFAVGDVELDSQEEMLFLGRDDDNIYFCERNTGTFRVLKICPSS